MSAQEQKKPFYKKWTFGVVVIYLILVVIHTICLIFSKGENRLLNSNEFGDFLAGTFAPLAFFFLLLGYKQQSIEIQNNTQERLEQKRQSLLLSQPFFHFKDLFGFIIHSTNSPYYFNFSFTLSNSRAICRQLFILVSFEDSLIGQLPTGDTSLGFISNNFDDQRDFFLITESEHIIFEDDYAVVYLLINYTDLNDSIQTQSLKLYFKNDSDGAYKYTHYIVHENSYQNKILV
ncbi:hypothetical protein ACOUV0_12940 [Acinetobacter baumannii]|nr:hypothetical protein [Acinetobacter baumannii]HBI8870579.1 hypothetical protein [Acinetobacter baumannii]